MKIRHYFLLLTVFTLSLSCSGNKEKKEAADTENKIESKSAPGDNESTTVVAADDRGYIVTVGDMAPDFTLQTTTGDEFKLSDMRGKVIMLQFTASWCGVCRKEMPFIESDIWQKYKDHPKFCLLGIDRDEPLEKVLEFAKQTGITYPVALDPGGDVFALYAERKAGITRNV
ncbi:MAG: TlpA family protein disulfide reductase, partial [Tannerella sp.]|nr:TlpA family protein disulfide reductase [Tannerella sp.]